MTKAFKKGYHWAFTSYLKGIPLKEIEDQADNSFDFSDFDRGALEAVRNLNRCCHG